MIQRYLLKKISPWILRDEILFLNGPRQVGKTTLMKEFQRQLDEKGKKTFYFNLENPNDLALTEDYEQFLSVVLYDLPPRKKVFVFLDEIQLHSRPSNFLKFIFDDYWAQIKLFVTGSANLDIKAKLQDSLVGRKKTFWLSPFNFSEFLEAKNFKALRNPLSHQEKIKHLLDEYLLYGGLPKIVLEKNISIKKELLNEYTTTYINRDIRHMIAENQILPFNHLLIFLAKIIGNLKNNSEIGKELQMNHLTLHRYLDLLKYTFVVDFLPPYFTNEISRIKKASKVYFFDNGVRNSLLSNFVSMEKRNDVGALFENAIFLHLKQKYDGNHVFYLRTSSNNEVDFVCETQKGKVDFYEAKYSRFHGVEIGKGFKALMRGLNLNKAHIVNLNLNQKKGKVDFISFDQIRTK